MTTSSGSAVFSASAARSGGAPPLTSTLATFPSAWTPVSVRPATTRPVVSANVAARASRSAPSTVRRPGCIAQPRNAVPSYATVSLRRTVRCPCACLSGSPYALSACSYSDTLYRLPVEREFLLQRVQPAMVGLVDGSLSTLAPIFSIALATHDTRYAFIAGLATALGAAVSMAFSEGLSDTGELTGRGSPVLRGTITGGGTFIGGILHSLPFLIPHYGVALTLAIAVVAFELLILAYFRYRFFQDTFLRALGIVTFAGIIIAAISAGLGSLLGSPTGS